MNSSTFLQVMALKVYLVDAVRLGGKHEGIAALLRAAAVDTCCVAFENSCASVLGCASLSVIDKAQVGDNWRVKLNTCPFVSPESQLDTGSNVLLRRAMRSVSMQLLKFADFVQRLFVQVHQTQLKFLVFYQTDLD